METMLLHWIKMDCVVRRRMVWSVESHFVVLFIVLQMSSQSSQLISKPVAVPDGVGKELRVVKSSLVSAVVSVVFS